MGRDDKKESFLNDLGRATMRGLRRCQKCGTLNGTRGYSCKNKSCDVVFKEAGEKKKLSTEACRIKTGTSAQIYSVRLRDKGPDYRAFVQLTVSESDPLFISTDLSESLQFVNSGIKCYVEQCQRSSMKQNSETSQCSHIKAASQCFKDAKELTFKCSILNSLPIPSEEKTDIWHLARGTSGPLVQRVSRSMFVVKCKPEPLHPLGFLHFSFQPPKTKDDHAEHKYYCNCRSFKVQPAARDCNVRKCVHLYACIVAFASDNTLAKEFEFYINLIYSDLEPEPVLSQTLKGDSEENQVDEEATVSATHDDSIKDLRESSFLILNGNGDSPCQVEVEVLRDDPDNILSMPLTSEHSLVTSTDGIDDKVEIQLRTENALQLHTSDGGTISVHHIPNNLPLSNVKREQDDVVLTSSVNLQDNTTKKGIKRILTGACAKKAKEPLDENTAGLPFLVWLGSVTERINQTMHFGFPGKPDPLVFHIPKVFFDCLMERINGKIKKKRAPNKTETLIRNDEVPIGKFTKSTWKIHNLTQVRQILDTPLMPLALSRSFIMNRDGTFRSFNLPSSSNSEESIFAAHRSPTQPALKPHEYKTVLRVGQPDPQRPLREPTPFIIEWIPDILPISSIGELRIIFEFDHKHNGQFFTFCDNKPNAAIATVTPITRIRSNGPPLLAPRPPPTESLIGIPISSDSIQTTDSGIATILTF